jgi:hypothetical protein
VLLQHAKPVLQAARMLLKLVLDGKLCAQEGGFKPCGQVFAGVGLVAEGCPLFHAVQAVGRGPSSGNARAGA